MQIRVSVDFTLKGGGVAAQADRNNRLHAEFMRQLDWLQEAFNHQESKKKFGKTAVKHLRAWLKQLQRDAGNRWWHLRAVRVLRMEVDLINPAGDVIATIDVLDGYVEWNP